MNHFSRLIRRDKTVFNAASCRSQARKTQRGNGLDWHCARKKVQPLALKLWKSSLVLLQLSAPPISLIAVGVGQLRFTSLFLEWPSLSLWNIIWVTRYTWHTHTYTGSLTLTLVAYFTYYVVLFLFAFVNGRNQNNNTFVCVFKYFVMKTTTGIFTIDVHSRGVYLWKEPDEKNNTAHSHSTMTFSK